jgi:hypothetical protein
LLHLSDRHAEGEQLGGDQLIVVVRADRVPVHAVGSDGHLGDERLGGEHQAVLGEPTSGQRAQDLVVRGDSEAGQETAQFLLLARIHGDERGRDPYGEPLAERGPDPVQRLRPATSPPVSVMAFRCGRVKADLEPQPITRQRPQRLEPAAAEQHPIGEQGCREDLGTREDDLAEVGQHKRLTAGEQQLRDPRGPGLPRQPPYPARAERAAFGAR